MLLNDVCEKLYKEVGFKNVNIKLIGENISFSRTSIYNYFETKEEIFLALVEREYLKWNNDLLKIHDIDSKISVNEFIERIVSSLSKRKILLKLISMNMYDMSRIAGNGYFDEQDNEESRYKSRVNLNNQRNEDYKNNNYALAGGVIDPLPENAPELLQGYHAYYKTPRGYHKRSLNSNKGWAIQTNTSMMNVRLFHYANEIRNAVMIIHGDKAHSFYMGKDAYDNMIKDSKYTNNKEFVIIPNATHTDLYDQKDKIPFNKIEEFIKKNID